jgi:branched-chain amino acid transport system permease protein
MTGFVQLVVSGLAVGSIYGLVALGFVVIFKSTGVFNFAQGDLVMVGAYLAYALMANAGVSLPVAIVGTLVLALVLGWLLQQVVFRPMLGAPLLTMVMVSIALSLVIRGVVFIAFGPADHGFPARLPSESITIFGVVTSELDLTVMAVAAATIIVFALFFRLTSLGLQLRAIGDNAEAAATVGVNANRMFSVAMMVGTVTAAIGGILLANLQAVSPQLSEIGLLAFPAAVLGGMRSIPGAVLGGVVIGVIGQLSTGYVGGNEANVVIYLALLAVLLVRPEGLLGAREVARV